MQATKLQTKEDYQIQGRRFRRIIENWKIETTIHWKVWDYEKNVWTNVAFFDSVPSHDELESAVS